MADPPWDHSDGFMHGVATGRSVGVGRPAPIIEKHLTYPTLSVAEIAALQIPAAADCRLFLWVTNRYLPAALSEVLPAWGFTYRQTLVWHKPDVPFGGSIAPNAEFLLVCTKGSPPRNGRIGTAVHTYGRRGLEHSQKPELFLDIAEQVSPGPYLEMFSRRARLGWHTWGNESLHGTEAVA